MSFVDNCLSQGFLVSGCLKDREDVNFQELLTFVNTLEHKPSIIDDDVIETFKNSKKPFFEKKLGSDAVVEVLPQKLRESSQSSVEVMKNYNLNNKMRSISDWFDFYQNRYTVMRKMLEHRTELKNAVSVSSILKMAGRNNVATIGLIKEIRKTNNGNVLVELEDPTGVIKALISSGKPELMRLSEDLIHDEIVGVVGSASNNFLFVSDILFPDIPEKEMAASPIDEYACMIADTHVGSIDFEKETYNRFLEWIKGKSGTEEQKETAKKVKYLFIIGDLVDGVGIYPGQDKELEIKDIYKQYEVFADYLKDLPNDLQLIFIPGNHDALRQSEPQPPLFSDIAKPVFELSNVRNLSNPSSVRIGAADNFPGLNVLMYHGFSYTYYATTVPKLISCGMDKPDNVAEFLLRKRHLAPSHASGLVTPESFDHLVIDTAPDVFVSGHIHSLGYRKYKATNIIATSCFQKMTSYMQKLGHHPTPGFVPLLNLKTRNVKVMNFT